MALATVLSAAIAALSAVAVALIGAGVNRGRRQQAVAISSHDSLLDEMRRALDSLERRENECNRRLTAAEREIARLERRLGPL